MHADNPNKDMQLPEKITELFRRIIESFTNHREAIELNQESFGSTIKIVLRVHMDDQGKVLGKAGQNVWSLETILREIATHYRVNINLTVLDPTTGRRLAKRDYRPDPNFKSAETVALLKDILAMALFDETRIIVHDSKLSDETDIEVHTSEREFCRMGNLSIALERIFRAIGNSKGRCINVKCIDPNAKEISSVNV